jgi:hypothetical protein
MFALTDGAGPVLTTKPGTTAVDGLPARACVLPPEVSGRAGAAPALNGAAEDAACEGCVPAGADASMLMTTVGDVPVFRSESPRDPLICIVTGKAVSSFCELACRTYVSARLYQVLDKMQ